MRDAPDHPEDIVRNLLHVSPYIHASAGGPPVVVERWAEFAGACGWRASVLSTPAFADDGGESLLHAARDRYELQLVPSARHALFGSGRAMVLGKIRDADIVHLHTMWSPLNAVVALACRQMNKPYVISPHGMLDPYSLGVKALRKQLYLKLIEGRTISGAASVLFTADEERDLAIEQVGNVPNPQVVGLGADMPGTSPERLAEHFRTFHPDLADKQLLIFLGRLHPKKRPDAVIRAMTSISALAPDAILLVVGGGEPRYVDKLRSLAGGLGLSQRVRFLGPLTGDAKWGALAASNLFVLPSLQENFAIAVAEALQVGIPVLITTKINTWREIVGAEAGLVLLDETLEADIARHVVDLLSDPETCRAMGSNGRALAQCAYTWPASAQKVCAVYDRVIARRGVASG